MHSPFKDRIVEGMEVRSIDGDKLGKVVSTHAESFMIEKGFFFPKDYLVSFDHVKDVREGTVHLGLTKQDLREGGSLLDKARSRLEEVGSEERVPPEGQGREELRVPLREEEVIVGRHQEQVGEVRIHKDVVTEEKVISVPVTREVVEVERVPATGAAPSTLTGVGFQEETLSIPIHEEKIDVEKREVVREEVVVSKEQEVEQAPVSETVRREVADVETRGKVRELDVERAEEEPPLRKTGT